MENFEKQQKNLINSTRLPYDMSNEKAKELKVEDWGTPEEVEKMARMLRNVNSRKEAEVILNGIKNKGKLINNYNDKLIATVSRDSIRKLLNGNWQIAVNIDQLFRNGIEPWKFELNPNKNNRELKDRKYLYSPMKYEEKIILVKLTIKEYKRHCDGMRLYSGEIINHELK
jgi:hypothetical protein